MGILQSKIQFWQFGHTGIFHWQGSLKRTFGNFSAYILYTNLRANANRLYLARCTRSYRPRSVCLLKWPSSFWIGCCDLWKELAKKTSKVWDLGVYYTREWNRNSVEILYTLKDVWIFSSVSALTMESVARILRYGTNKISWLRISCNSSLAFLWSVVKDGVCIS